MASKVKKVGDLSVEEFRALIEQVVEEKLESFLPRFFVDEDGFRIAGDEDSEDILSFKQEFKDGLKRAQKEVQKGRVKDLDSVWVTIV